jgi:hypothetical protein
VTRHLCRAPPTCLAVARMWLDRCQRVSRRCQRRAACDQRVCGCQHCVLRLLQLPSSAHMLVIFICRPRGGSDVIYTLYDHTYTTDAPASPARAQSPYPPRVEFSGLSAREDCHTAAGSRPTGMLSGRATAPETTRPTRPAKPVGWTDVLAFVLRSDVARTDGDGENGASCRIPVQLRKMLDARPVAATDGAHGPGGRRGQRSAHGEGARVDF